MLANSSFSSFFTDWESLGTCRSLFTAYFCCSVLFLPVFLPVLYINFQRWRKRRSGANMERMSHSDVLTVNIVSLELISFCGCCVYCYGTYSRYLSAYMSGVYLWLFVLPAQTLFHVLTCVDRYLAVVYPVTYLGLRGAVVIRVRNISIVCFWLISFAYPSFLLFVSFGDLCHFIFLSLSAVVVVFCSISVLRTLIRPGPGGRVCNGERVNPTKRRAFNTIMAITGTLVLRFLSLFILELLDVIVNEVSYTCVCMKTWSFAWFSVPSSLVLPLLFLQRAGKPPTRK